jgi:hypothetical protein
MTSVIFTYNKTGQISKLRSESLSQATLGCAKDQSADMPTLLNPETAEKLINEQTEERRKEKTKEIGME